MPYRKSLAETSREIKFLVEFIKFNSAHDHLGRFTTTSEAHLLVHRDGRRELGPKHPEHPNNKLSPTQKIEKAMHEKYPKTDFCFEGIEPAYAQKMADHIDKLMTAYPDVKLGFVGVPKVTGSLNDLSGTPGFALKDGKFWYGDDANAYLATHTWIGSGFAGLTKKGETYYSTAMVLNPKVFANEKNVLQRVGHGYSSGFFPAGIPVEDRSIATITHEFGHAIHSHLLYGGLGKALPGLDAIGKGDKEGEVSRMTDYWTNLHRKDEAAVSGYVRSAAQEVVKDKPDNGKRRATAEAIAEAFRQMTLAPEKYWTPYTKSLHKFLNDTYSQPWNDKPKKVDMTKDSSASRALKKKLDALTIQLQKSRATQSVLPPIPGGEIFLCNPKPHVEFSLPQIDPKEK